MKNMGSLDRIIRTVLGLALIGAAIYLQITTERFWWIGLPGAIFLFTASISTCPLYIPFKISTKGKEK